eukprot:3411022-Pleurochrysis_carterae.AAC.2
MTHMLTHTGAHAHALTQKRARARPNTRTQAHTDARTQSHRHSHDREVLSRSVLTHVRDANHAELTYSKRRAGDALELSARSSPRATLRLHEASRASSTQVEPLHSD